MPLPLPLSMSLLATERSVPLSDTSNEVWYIPLRPGHWAFEVPKNVARCLLIFLFWKKGPWLTGGIPPSLWHSLTCQAPCQLYLRILAGRWHRSHLHEPGVSLLSSTRQPRFGGSLKLFGIADSNARHPVVLPSCWKVSHSDYTYFFSRLCLMLSILFEPVLSENWIKFSF